jgi:sugar-specific transcriptional regulator TrmB
MIESILKTLGLLEKESLVYTTLLKIGAQPVSTIARKSNINRTTCYSILEDLKHKGLVFNYLKAKINYFEAFPPVAIKNNLEKDILNIKDKLDFFQKNVKALSSLGNNLLLKPKIYFFEGLEGIKKTYEDTLTSKTTIYAIESVSAMSDEVKDYLLNEYIPKRVKLNIYAESILPNKPLEKFFKANDKSHYRQTKIITDPDFQFDFKLNIYDNKVSLIVYSENQYSSFIIENQIIAESLKSFHQFMWKNIL